MVSCLAQLWLATTHRRTRHWLCLPRTCGESTTFDVEDCTYLPQQYVHGYNDREKPAHEKCFPRVEAILQGQIRHRLPGTGIIVKSWKVKAIGLVYYLYTFTRYTASQSLYTFVKYTVPHISLAPAGGWYALGSAGRSQHWPQHQWTLSKRDQIVQRIVHWSHICGKTQFRVVICLMSTIWPICWHITVELVAQSPCVSMSGNLWLGEISDIA